MGAFGDGRDGPDFGAGVLVEVGGGEESDVAFLAGEGRALRVVVEGSEAVFPELVFEHLGEVGDAGGERVVDEEADVGEAAVGEHGEDGSGVGGTDGPGREDGVGGAGVGECPEDDVGEAEAAVADEPRVVGAVEVAEGGGDAAMPEAEGGFVLLDVGTRGESGEVVGYALGHSARLYEARRRAMSKKKSKRGGRDRLVAVKMTASEKAGYEAMARERGVTLSDLLREAPVRERQLASLNARLLIEMRMTRTAGVYLARQARESLVDFAGQADAEALAGLTEEERATLEELSGWDTERETRGFDNLRRTIAVALHRRGWGMRVMPVGGFPAPTRLGVNDFVETMDFAVEVGEGEYQRVTLPLVQVALEEFEAAVGGETFSELKVLSGDGLLDVEGVEVVEDAMVNSVTGLGPRVGR